MKIISPFAEAEVAKAATQIGTTVLPEIVSRSFSDEDEEYVDDNASNVNDEEYDSDGIPTARKEKAGIKALKTIDHSLIQYPSVRFDFYQESADIRALTPAALNSFLNELEIQVTGLDVPRPIQSFTQLSSTLPAKLIDAIHNSGAP